MSFVYYGKRAKQTPAGSDYQQDGGTGITKWDMAQQYSNYIMQKHLECDRLFDIMVSPSDFEYQKNAPFLLYLRFRSYWAFVRAVAVKNPKNANLVAKFDAHIPHVEELCLRYMEVPFDHKIIDELQEFYSHLKALAQKIGWGLPMREKPISEEQMLDILDRV